MICLRLFTIFLLLILAIDVSAQKNVSPDRPQTTAITAEELRKLVKSPAKRQPILINLWATWCGPCRVEFPDLVKIDTDYRAKGLNFFLVSVDDYAIIDTRVPEFLEQYEAKMPSYLINLEDRRKIAAAVRQIAPRFPDRYPLTLLFDASGKLVYQKIGVIDAQILRREIDKVLTKTEK